MSHGATAARRPTNHALGPTGTKALLLGGLVALYLWTVSRSLRLPNAYSIGHWLQSYAHGFIKRGLLGTALRPLLDLKGPDQVKETITFVSFSIFALFSVAMVGAAAMILRRDNRPVSLAVAVVFLGSPFIVFSAHLVGYFDPLIAVIGVVSVYLAARGRWLGAGLLSTVAILVHEMYAITCMPMVLFCAWFHLSEVRARDRWRPMLELLLGPVLALIVVLLSSLLQSDQVVASIRQDIAARGVIDQYWVDMTTYHLEHGFLDNFQREQRWAWVRLRNKNLASVVFPALIALLLGAATRLYQLRRTRWIPVFVALALSPWLMHAVAWDMERIAILPLFTAFLGFFGLCALPEPASDTRTLPQRTVVAVVVLCIAAAAANAWTHVPLMDGERDGEGRFSIDFSSEPEVPQATPP